MTRFLGKRASRGIEEKEKESSIQPGLYYVFLFLDSIALSDFCVHILLYYIHAKSGYADGLCKTSPTYPTTSLGFLYS